MSSITAAVESTTHLTWEDIIVVVLYFISVIIVGLYVSIHGLYIIIHVLLLLITAFKGSRKQFILAYNASIRIVGCCKMDRK